MLKNDYSLLRDKPVSIDGLTYKIGVHNKVFYLGTHGWIYSCRHPSEVAKALELKAAQSLRS